MKMELAGRTIAITGAFGNLGAQIVLAAESAGARVAAIDVAPASAIARGAQVHSYGGVDLGDPKSALDVFDRIARELGALDGLVNVAGGFRWERITDGSIDAWDAMYRINVRTAVIACQAALPHLLARGPGGRIVNVGALGAVKAAAGMGAYAASKAGVARLTESLAEELKDRGITVNAILPSIIDTPANRRDMPDADSGRWVQPREIADMILFLLSPRAQAVTGALLPVPGRV